MDEFLDHVTEKDWQTTVVETAKDAGVDDLLTHTTAAAASRGPSSARSRPDRARTRPDRPTPN